MNNLSPTDIATTDLWVTFFKSAAMLCIVLGVLITVLFLIKRFLHTQGRPSKLGMIKVIASHYIAPKESLLLVDVLGEKLLIGVTSQNINCIAKIENKEDLIIDDNTSDNSRFIDVLKSKIGKRFNNDNQPG